MSTLPLRTLGRTGFKVTALGLGGAWLGWTPNGVRKDLATATVLRALQSGINMIDTYNHNEGLVGEALEGWFQRGRRRDELVICSKVDSPDFPAEKTLRRVKRSMENLRTDYVDIVLIHDPESMEPIFAPNGTLSALKRLKSEGIIRAIGLGVRSHDFLCQAIESGEFDVVLTHLDFNLLNQSAAVRVLPLAAKHNVGVINGSPLAMGLLTDEDPFIAAQRRNIPPNDERVRKARALWEWARDQGLSLLATSLRFCLLEERISTTLVGASFPEHVDEAVSALTVEISPKAWDELHERFGIFIPGRGRQ